MSTQSKITVSQYDYEKLESLFVSNLVNIFCDKPYLSDLRKELDNAAVVSREEIPADIVTMNSVVRLRETYSKESQTYKLVYPEDANIYESKLSVLAPIGTAILGCKVGDLVSYQVPSGTCRCRIMEIVFQPEREGVLV